jgi:hypothetical protein
MLANASSVISSSTTHCALRGKEAEQEAQAVVGQVLATLSEPCFVEAKRAILLSLSFPDYSGSEVLTLAMDDLECSQRLILFGAWIRQVEAVSFAQIKSLSALLTPERLFRFIIRPS